LPFFDIFHIISRFSSIFSISFHISTCLSSIFSIYHVPSQGHYCFHSFLVVD
jgi:hypothetical protein